MRGNVRRESGTIDFRDEQADTETRFGGSIGMYIGEYASRRAEGDL